MRTRFGVGLAIALTMAAAVFVQPATAESRITPEVLDLVVKTCATPSPGVIWATPGSAVRLCPCWVDNIMRASDLTEGQKLYVMAELAGRAMRSLVPPLFDDRKEAAYKFRTSRMYEGCSP